MLLAEISKIAQWEVYADTGDAPSVDALATLDTMRTAGGGLAIGKVYDRSLLFYVLYDISWFKFLKKVSQEQSRGGVDFPYIKQLVKGYVSLSAARRGWVGKEVGLVWITPELRGKGFGKILYDTVLKDSVILLSGNAQTLSSKRLWMSLVKNPNYTVWAHDLYNLNHRTQVYWDKEKNRVEAIDPKINIYDSWKDIRLVAIARRVRR